MKKMQPIGSWLKDSFDYLVQNCLMLLKVYGYGMLIYVGSMLLIMIVGGVGSYVFSVLGNEWIVLAGFIAVVFGLFALIFLVSMAGKMVYFMILAAKSPITDIRKSWATIFWKDGLSLYVVMLLVIFAGYGGMIFLIIPGIIVFTWVSLAMFLRVDQGIRGLKALMLSRDYVKGYFWPIMGRYLIAMLISFALVFVVLFGFSKLNEMGGVLAIFGWALYLIGMLAMMAAMYRLLYTLYLDLVRIKGKLEVKANSWRTFGWGLLVVSPLIVMIVAIVVLISINPAKQIQKARENKIMQQRLQISK